MRLSGHASEPIQIFAYLQDDSSAPTAAEASGSATTAQTGVASGGPASAQPGGALANGPAGNAVQDNGRELTTSWLRCAHTATRPDLPLMPFWRRCLPGHGLHLAMLFPACRLSPMSLKLATTGHLGGCFNQLPLTCTQDSCLVQAVGGCGSGVGGACGSLSECRARCAAAHAQASAAVVHSHAAASG